MLETTEYRNDYGPSCGAAFSAPGDTLATIWAEIQRKEAAGAQEGQATAKQEAFAREMAKPRAKQQDAYRAAYDCKRMNYNSISCAASKLMRDPRIAHRIQEIRDAAAKDCRWELQDAAAPLFEVLDGALPIFRRQAAEGSINGDARLAITESVKLLNDMFGVDGAKAAMAEAGVTIVDDLG